MKVTSRILALLFAFALLLPGQVSAQSGNTKQDKIMKMLEVTGMSDMLDQMIVQMMPVIRQQIVTTQPGIKPEHLDIVLNVTQEELRANQSEILELIIAIYQQQLTEEEIDASIAFYSTPVGQSLLRKTPQLMQSSMLAGQQWAQGIMPDVQKRLSEKLQELGYKI